MTRRRRVSVLVALAVLTAALAVTAVLAELDRWQTVDRRRDRGDALAAARTLTERVLSFDSRTLSADVARARESVAGEFADEYDRIARSLIETAGRSSGTSVRSRVTRGGVVSDGLAEGVPRVTVLLFVDQTVASAAAPAPRPATVQAEVTMTEVAGQWLVSGLRPF